MRSYFFSFLLVSSLSVVAQSPYPQNYFINPLGIPIYLAGTFGEIRSDHYHTGIDIRTQGKEGLPVYAVADGYISRILVSPYGYGNALYITHPNGYTSLYGHLSRFNRQIMKYVRKKQYESQHYVQDIPLASGEMVVKQGDTVAFSGSTGAAEGAHLHFEIRKSANDDPINPFLFGYTTTDHLPPIIKGIAIYPLNDTSNVNGRHHPVYLPVEIMNNRYFIIGDTSITAYGSIGIGISCFDVADSTDNRNGPYIKVLKDNGDTIYYTRMDDLSFATIHYINGHIDYAAMHEKIDTLEFSFLQDNDKLKIYKKLVNNGRLYCKDGKLHTMQYNISDYNGNTSTLSFGIQSDEKRGRIYRDTAKYIGVAHWQKPYDYSGAELQVHIPAEALFKDMPFRYYSDHETMHTSVSPLFEVGDEDVPLDANYTLMIKPHPELADSLMKKVVMIRLEGEQKISVGGKWENGFVTAHPRAFGCYALVIDLYRPVIKPLNIYKGKDMSREKDMEFEVTDNLSGVSSFNGYVDGKWILVEYNPKKNMLYYTFDEHVEKGEHSLKLVVSDEVGNTSVYKTEFTR